MSQDAAKRANTDQSQKSVDAVQETMNQFLSAANIDAVYGEPVHEGTTTVIPCAEVLSVAGFGMGYGYGGPAQGSGDGSGGGMGGPGGGGGGGGGGRVLSRPVAVIEVTPS